VVDRQVTAYLEAEGPARRAASARIAGQLDAVRAELDGLDGLRSAARSGTLTRQAVTGEYTESIRSLLEVDLPGALRGGDEQLAQSVRAFTDLARVKELTARLRGSLYAIATRDRFDFGEFQDLADLLAQERAALDRFGADATDQQRALYSSTVRGQAVLAVARVERAATDRQSRPRLAIDPRQWLAASTTEIELQRIVESRLLDAVIAHSGRLGAAAQRRVALGGGLTALVLAVAVLTSLAVAQSMVRPLKRLRAGALRVAEHRLPAAVDASRTVGRGGVEVLVEPIGEDSADEIGEVARAFDVVHRAAVRLASEQAALRRSISDMFLNLARRSQALIDRQLELIDELEEEADSKTLSSLFQLDHLATRMRRNAENLIVLSGTEPARRWSRPIPLVEVVRAAAQEVEEYRRVRLLDVGGLDLAGHAAADVVHLLAELIENATAFSPPGTPVRVTGQPTAAGYVVEVEDRGLGMSESELAQANRRLADPPAIDAALSQRLGLFVVGKLAQRHGIKAQLRHSWCGGVTALVLLPSALTIPSTSAGQPPGDWAELPPPSSGTRGGEPT
jgi:signal transduction histidine kinase